MTNFTFHNNNTWETFPFVKNGHPLDKENNPNVPVCGLTLRSAGSMRFRWAENNLLRNQMLCKLSDYFDGKTFVPVELNHTKIVYDVCDAGDTDQKVGDGIITLNKNLIPTITVADCVPIYLFDDKTGVFGIVHSGWKGTGIAGEAIRLAQTKYGSRAEDFCAAIGPHIHNCCYIVNEERAEYFARNFTAECVTPLEEGVKVDWNNGEGRLYRLSLAKANLAVLEKSGVKRENIFVHPDCTCCTSGELYGSNRRETKKNGRPDQFTVQAAFIAF